MVSIKVGRPKQVEEKRNLIKEFFYRKLIALGILGGGALFLFGLFTIGSLIGSLFAQIPIYFIGIIIFLIILTICNIVIMNSADFERDNFIKQEFWCLLIALAFTGYTLGMWTDMCDYAWNAIPAVTECI